MHFSGSYEFYRSVAVSSNPYPGVWPILYYIEYLVTYILFLFQTYIAALIRTNQYFQEQLARYEKIEDFKEVTRDPLTLRAVIKFKR